MTRHEYETELIQRIRQQGCEVKLTGQLHTYCGVTWEQIQDDPYIVTLPTEKGQQQ